MKVSKAENWFKTRFNYWKLVFLDNQLKVLIYKKVKLYAFWFVHAEWHVLLYIVLYCIFVLYSIDKLQQLQ